MKIMVLNDFLYLREMIRYFMMNELMKFWMISEVQGVHIHTKVLKCRNSVYIVGGGGKHPAQDLGRGRGIITKPEQNK